MDLICYLHPGWEPGFQPGEVRRDWMDQTPEAFAYRCLPLSIANAHGWEVPCPVTFEASWTGRNGVEDVQIRLPADAPRHSAPVSIFGQGVLTFHIFGLIRTSPGWNLWVGGAPNRWKRDIYPLTGVIETDWSPYTFTMNWRFMRPHRTVRFEAGEPICFFFPVPRGLDEMTPKYLPLEAAPELMEQFQAWCRSRSEFQAEVAKNPPSTPSAKWQKRYYRGIDMRDRNFAEHQAKLRVKPFMADDTSSPAVSRPDPAASAAPEIGLRTDATTLGRTLRAMADALENGCDRAALRASLDAIGLAPEQAEQVIDAALA